jgi:hypothetical protein
LFFINDFLYLKTSNYIIYYFFICNEKQKTPETLLPNCQDPVFFFHSAPLKDLNTCSKALLQIIEFFLQKNRDKLSRIDLPALYPAFVKYPYFQ